MSVSRRELMRWQFDLTWSLFEYHLDRLRPEDFLWEPGPHCWTVRQAADGSWVPDWAETEPDPVPVPTIAWVSWHIGWWWSVAADHLWGRTPRERTAITWPGEGDATVAWLRDLRADWLAALERLDDRELDAPARFPWPNDPQYTVAHMIGWVNAELMKNVAEIGQLRLLRDRQPGH
ncbi:DinB family protein [Streptomyces sp. NPDC006385]|uniref:DinB family protein n=1 Tax=Streptomyces sp. NPDC006385 TaxID=3156761 RepID=UPI0033B92FBB